MITRRAVLAGAAGAGVLAAAGCRGSDVAGVTVRSGIAAQPPLGGA